MMELCMKNAGGDTIRITDVRSGSIKVTVQGSPRDIARLLDQINARNLTEVEGLPIQDCRILSEDFLSDVGQHSNAEKWELIADIVNNPKIARQLSGSDLSDADLSNAILISADLTNADLSGADLSTADLRSFRSFLDIRDRLNRLNRLDRLDRLNCLDHNANLEGADLTDAIVEGCQFGDGVGLSAIEKEHLKRRGGIFNDAPGDRSSVETPSPNRR